MACPWGKTTWNWNAWQRGVWGACGEEEHHTQHEGGYYPRELRWHREEEPILAVIMAFLMARG